MDLLPFIFVNTGIFSPYLCGHLSHWVLNAAAQNVYPYPNQHGRTWVLQENQGILCQFCVTGGIHSDQEVLGVPLLLAGREQVLFREQP